MENNYLLSLQQAKKELLQNVKGCVIIQKLKIEKIPFLKKCSTHATIFQFGLKCTKMLRMSSEVVLAQLVFVLQQGMARVYFIPQSCHICRKSVIVEENTMLL